MSDSIPILHCFKPSITWTTFKQLHFYALNATHTSWNMRFFAHQSPKASAVLSSLMFPVAGRIRYWLSRMVSYFITLHALQEDGCTYRYGICLHIYHWHGNKFYHTCTYNRLPEDVPLGLKHAEDIIKINILI